MNVCPVGGACVSPRRVCASSLRNVRRCAMLCNVVQGLQRKGAPRQRTVTPAGQTLMCRGGCMVHCMVVMTAGSLGSARRVGGCMFVFCFSGGKEGAWLGGQREHSFLRSSSPWRALPPCALPARAAQGRRRACAWVCPAESDKHSIHHSVRPWILVWRLTHPRTSHYVALPLAATVNSAHSAL